MKKPKYLPNKMQRLRDAVADENAPLAKPAAVRQRDLFGICAQKARRDGVDLYEMLWAITKGQVLAAEQGNVKAAALVYDRLLGPVDRVANATQVNVAVDASQRTTHEGPPIPSAEVLTDQLNRLAHLIKSGDAVVVDKQAEADELLS